MALSDFNIFISIEGVERQRVELNFTPSKPGLGGCKANRDVKPWC